MARARNAPATSSARQPEPPPFDKVVATAGAGELLPPEAAVAAVPVGGAVTVAAATASSLAVLAAFDAFTRKRRRQLRVYLVETLPRLYPERLPEEVLRFVRDEMARDRAFVAKQRARLERDVKKAMLLDSPEKRRIRLQQILERERKYTQKREQAALERAAARANFLTVKEQSPEGAFWVLGLARIHTPDCVAMAGKFWPWEVLDHYHPQLHFGCQCGLLSKDEAVMRGLMHPDQVPDTADAIRRAAEIARQYDLIREAARPDEIRSYLEEILEAPYRALHTHRVQARYAKGTHEGGKFRPKSGVGTPIRRSIRKALTDLIPHAPTSPAQRRRDHVGEWKRIAGREVFVPEHRAFEREIGGRMWYSPPGSTKVYAQRDYVRRSPEIPRERGDELTDTARRQRQEWRVHANGVATRALAAQDQRTPPAEVGFHPKATHGGMVDAGFVSRRQEISPTSGSITWHYEHPASGAKAAVTYHDHRVTNVAWQPGQVQERKAVLDRPPTDLGEFLDDVLSIAHEIAERHDRRPEIARATINDALSDASGVHGWDGVLQLGPDVRKAIRDLAAARAEGRALNYQEARNAYAAYRTAVHEALHAAAPISQRAYNEPVNRALEEALTEELAIPETIRVLRRQGLDDVLRWVKANPADFKVEGTYSRYRIGLGRVLDRAKIEPEKRESILSILKFSFEPEQRPDGLAALLTEGGRGYMQNHEQARAWVQEVFERAHIRQERDDDAIIAPQIRADLSDVRDTPPVVIRGEEVHAGSWVEVDREAGRVMRVIQRDEGPLFDVQFGTQWSPTRMAHGVHADQITKVGNPPEGAPQGQEIVVGSTTLRPGDTVSYLNGLGPRSRSTARIERIIRVQNPDMVRPERGWQVEATTLSGSQPGEPVMLTHERARGLRKEAGMFRRSPGGERHGGLAVRDYEGEVGNRSHITRHEEGMIPIAAIAHLRGVAGEAPGEHRNKKGDEWDMFVSDVKTNGVREPIFITVDHGAEPKISEGNHRRDAAVEAGLAHVPVEIRYFGHAERQGTVLERTLSGGERSAPLSFEGGEATRPPTRIKIGKDGDVRHFPMREIVARDASGVEVGRLSYGYDPDRNILALARIDVNAELRRQGIGTELLGRARALHPGAEVDPGFFVSTEGEAWWGAMTGAASPGGERRHFANYGPVPEQPPKFRQIGPGNLDSEDGRITMYRVEGVRPTAWNVEWTTDYADAVQGTGNVSGYGHPIYENIVDGAASKKDAEALFRAAWPQVREHIIDFEGKYRARPDADASERIAAIQRAGVNDPNEIAATLVDEDEAAHPGVWEQVGFDRSDAVGEYLHEIERAEAQRGSPGGERETLQNDQRVYVAEGVMKRAGLDGGEMLSRVGHAYHPTEEGRAEAERLSKMAQEISGDPSLRVNITDWISGAGGNKGIAFYDRMSHTVAIRPVSDKLTFLHEIAHAMTRTEHTQPDGHGSDFVANARDLYEKHISPEAARIFESLATPPVERRSSGDERRAARRDMATNLQVGDEVYWQGSWLPVLQVSRTSEGMRVVYSPEGWYDLIPPQKVVRARRRVVEAYEEARHPRNRLGRWQDVPGLPHVVGSPEHHALYEEIEVSDHAILAAVRKAVEQRPERITHGNTGDNSFFIVGDEVFAHADYNNIPRDERSRAIMVHSHSADGVPPRAGIDYYEHESKQPLNSGDMEIWLSEMRKGRMGPRQVMVYADGTADILGITEDTDDKVLKWGSKRIRDSMPSIASADAREKYREWFVRHGFSYHEQVRWATREEAAHWRAMHPRESVRATGEKLQEARFAERLHPRDRLGKWRGKLGAPRLVLKAEKKLTKPQVQSRVQKVADALVDFYGGDKVQAFHEPEYLATVGSDARFRHEGEILSGLLYGTRAYEHLHHPDFGVEWFRVIAHEAAHSLSGVRPGPNPGFSQTFEEGAAEILSLWFWHHKGQEFDARDATRVDGKWTKPGAESLVNHVQYREWTEETLKRAASKVGWHRHAIIDEVEAVMRGDHGVRLRFRDETTPDVRPPEGVGNDAVSLVRWLLDDGASPPLVESYEERLHPRGRGGRWVASMYHGTSRGGAESIVRGGFRSRSGIIFATSHKDEAHAYAGSRGAVVKVTVDLRNPLVVHEGENLGNKLRELGVQNPSASPEGEREQAAALHAHGYDGIVQHLAEDLRDPSDPMPARTVARVVDPNAIRVGHEDRAHVEDFVSRDPTARLPLGQTAGGAADVLPFEDVMPKGETAAAIRAAQEAIDSVHWLTTDREVDPVPVAEWYDGTAAEASYASGRDGTLLYPHFIRMNPHAQSKEMAFAHEWGHYTDQQFLGKGVHYGSVLALSDEQHPLNEVMGALVETRELQQINELRQRTDTVKLSPDREVNLGDYTAYFDYLVSAPEAYARAYAQWIAMRSGNEAMKAQVSRMAAENALAPVQWTDESFAPVAAAMDAAFDKLGWRST